MSLCQGATGNVASEDVIYMLNGMGIETGVNLSQLVEAGRFISDFLQRPNGSRGPCHVVLNILPRRIFDHAVISCHRA